MFDSITVAELLGTTRDHVLDLIKSGRLSAINVGLGPKKPRWRISQEALDAFLEIRSAPAPRPAPRRKRPGAVTEYF